MEPKPIKIALAGNPNSGKTTLFNKLTGSRQRIGNWPGVTIEKKEGTVKGLRHVTVQDLPGIYSLSPYTPEEEISRNFLLNEQPDVILNIVDSSNLERNLYLTTQLLELEIPVVVALNFIDVARRDGDKIDSRKLESRLGCPVIETSALKGEGVEECVARCVRMVESEDKQDLSLIHIFSQAQSIVKQLMTELEAERKDVKFAIHPVAGRMPGHMNVLLAEVDIPYDKLYEMQDINDAFKDTDVAIVIGANDVVNPAANTATGTPIYGMPILDVEDAKHLIICNFDKLPGYAGVDNPLYEEGREDKIALMLGDAKMTLNTIMVSFRAAGDDATDSDETSDVSTPEGACGRWLRDAESVIIVPGYGMALSQAQSTVKQLMMELEAEGKDVKFAIHPVAGRMPGHMNVLLAEVDIPYDKLYEMQDINEAFKDRCV